MELDLTDEQKMLADAVKGLLDKRYGATARLELLEKGSADGEHFSRELWKQYAEQGLLGLTVDEQYGGAGMGSGELAVVMEQFGRALILEPFVATVVLGAGILSALGTPEQKERVLPGVAGGETFLAFAHNELGSRWSLTGIETTATKNGEGWTLSGQKIAVLGGDVADQLLVTAQTPDGLGVFLVDGAAVSRDTYLQQDGLGGADILLDGAAGELVGEVAETEAALGLVLDTATAMLCFEAVGAMERALYMTVDYLKTRQQFGVTLSVFQALQFRAADMYVSFEQAKSMAMLAQRALEVDDPIERHRMVAAAKVQIDLSGKHIGQDAIQLHGGIGVTMEYPVGHYTKRLTVLAKTLADTDTLIEQVGEGAGLVPA